MRKHTVVQAVSLVVILFAASVLGNPTEAAAAMCNGPNSCGICCYGTYEEIESCCVSNGCVNYCGLSSSGCCIGGYQINYPEECY